MNASTNTIDTHADLALGLDHLSNTCTTMEKIIKSLPDVPLRRTDPGFASLASIIISQQVSKQSAEAIYGRMQEFVRPLTPEEYIKCGEAVWIKIGLSRPKQRTFLATCEAIASRQLDLDILHTMPAESAVEHMTKVKGIGPWTAEVYLLFAVGHPDIFPAGDLALQIAAADAYGLSERPTDKQLRACAEQWAPWRGVAARVLWAHYAQVKGRSAMP